MYQVGAFREERIDVMHALMRNHRLATLVTVNDGVPQANHLPLLIDPEPAPAGTLRGHVARANPVWREADGREVLVIFQGPQAYVTPSWYPSKRETGQVVPTWNYAVVHAYGRLVVHDDREWLRTLVTRLTDQQEAGRQQPWRVDDAPPDYVDRMLGAIVGIEIPVSRLAGKWKVSQNRSEADRSGVAEGLRQSDEVQAQAMAALVAGERPV
jgi:transcriptional regulator